MFKSALIVLIFFALMVGVLIWFQPSPQESAISSLATADKLLESVGTGELASQLTMLRKLVADPKLRKSAEAQDRAILALDEVQSSVSQQQVRLNATASGIKAQLAIAKANLTSVSAAERARTIRSQILVLIWPFIGATLLLYLIHLKKPEAWGKTLKDELGTVISNIKLGPAGAELTLVGPAAGISQKETLRRYRSQVIDLYDAAGTRHSISDTVARILSGRISKKFPAQFGDDRKFRCTIHVKDMLFENSLYQLIDYLPSKWTVGEKGGRGRAWSARFGLMGRCWRLEESNEHTGLKGTRDLIEDWGMTGKEAEAASPQTICCVLIRARNQSPLALFYLDAEGLDAFGDSANMQLLRLEVENAVKEFYLDSALEKVWEEVQVSAPLIEIYGRK